MAFSAGGVAKTIWIEDWGFIPYELAWRRQRTYMEQARANPTAWRDRLILCEHPPVITLGRNARSEHVLFSTDYLAARGIEVYAIERGGDVTYHGPGQIIGYPILWLERYKADVSWYMRALEEVIIRTLKLWGLQAERLEGLTGVWLLEPPRKIAALGVKLSRWVSMHGFALNVNTDLSGFQWIIPCGLRDKAVTSMQKELGYAVPLEAVKAELVRRFGEVFGVETIIATGAR